MELIGKRCDRWPSALAARMCLHGPQRCWRIVLKRILQTGGVLTQAEYDATRADKDLVFSLLLRPCRKGMYRERRE